jgi:NAD(P)-dependent dehydrogenase (short-subunit alcohol dehydrogenase family)
MKNVYIINGINSDLAQFFLKKKSLSDILIIGVHRSSYKGIRNKRIILVKSYTKIRKIIDKKIKGETKIIFINFAASRDDKLILNLDIKNINKIIESNILSSIKIAKEIIPHMIKYKFGRFIFLSSSKAEFGSEGNALYSFSKAGLQGLSRSISKEYAKFNITSNIISLGYFNTRMWSSLKNNIKRDLLNKTLNKKLGNPMALVDIIKIIVKYNFINMAKINIDGGVLE